MCTSPVRRTLPRAVAYDISYWVVPARAWLVSGRTVLNGTPYPSYPTHVTILASTIYVQIIIRFNFFDSSIFMYLDILLYLVA